MFYYLCGDCGGPLEYYRSDYGLCEDCEPDWDGEDNDDDYEDDWDNPFSLFDPYWSGDVPDPFDQKVKARRRRFLRWSRRKHSSVSYCFKWSWLPIRLTRERERLAG